MGPISREDSRAVDRTATERYRIPSICLMENAGAGAARVAVAMLDGRAGDVFVVAGPGQNGGDALVVARHLALADYSIRIALLGPRDGTDPREDAGVQLTIVRAMGFPVLDLREAAAQERVAAAAGAADLLVDGLFGTGLDRPLDGLAAGIVQTINGSGSDVLALDVPSGLDCDTGEPLGACVRATVTATFVAPKVGFAAPGAAEHTGRIEVVSIGAPRTWSAPA